MKWRFALAALLGLIGPAHAELLPPVQQPASIPSNFDIYSWITAADVPGAESGGGAFRFICNVAKLGRFDPLVYPGQGAAGHMHTFFGNTLVTENSTYDSLRTSGDSSCQGGPLNRSSYWMPTLMRTDGKAIIPQWIGVYYKGEPSSWAGPPGGFSITDHTPRGLRYIFGYDKDRPELGSHHEWVCYGPNGGNTTPAGTIADMLADPVGCPAGGFVVVRIHSPNCWNGLLDSPNHRDHVAYGGYGSGLGYYECPSSHPRRLPQFSIIANYSFPDPAEIKTWYLSSDRMPGMPDHPAGSTFHSDWFGAWDDTVMATWHNNCIEKSLNCSGFVLGNGTQGKYPTTFTFDQQPRLVDPPADQVGPPGPIDPPPVVTPPSPRWSVFKINNKNYELRDRLVRPLPAFNFPNSSDAQNAASYLNSKAP